MAATSQPRTTADRVPLHMGCSNGKRVRTAVLLCNDKWKHVFLCNMYVRMVEAIMCTTSNSSWGTHSEQKFTVLWALSATEAGVRSPWSALRR